TAFAKERLKMTEGGASVSIGGTKGQEFIEPLSTNYVARRRASAFAVSNRMAEESIIRGYGTEITEAMARAKGFHNIEQMMNSREFLAPLKAERQVVYTVQTGKNAGAAHYILDGGTSNMLNRMLNPERMAKFLKSWTKVHNWWKARATVLRPGFAVRNILGGNLFQLWEADADIIVSMAQAAKAMRVAARKSPTEISNTIRQTIGGLDDVASKAIPKKQRWMVGEHTMEEA
ncbi:unnamed protein product, partial [marine sediment metagenome]